MTFDPADPATWPEELRDIDPEELRKFADALTCAVIALKEGAMDTRIEFQGDRRLAVLAEMTLAAIRAEPDAPTVR